MKFDLDLPLREILAPSLAPPTVLSLLPSHIDALPTLTNLMFLEPPLHGVLPLRYPSNCQVPLLALIEFIVALRV